MNTPSETQHGNRYKHGHALGPGKQTVEYAAWCRMKRRCYDEKNNRFKYYGGRGIKVCDRWKDSFINFIADMGARPDGCSLGRKNNDEDYSPANCRWETSMQQANNRSSNIQLTGLGQTHNLSEWAIKLNIPETRIACRLKRGWSVQKALFTPSKRPDIKQKSK